MVTMLCDHIAAAFLDDNILLRSIGRFAFIIYAFLLAEGYRHIKNDPQRVSKHLGGYIVLAVVSEFCYDLFEFRPLTIDNMISGQSAMITLLLAFLGLIAIDKWKDKPLYMWSSIILTALMNFFVMSNYKFAGVLLVYAFYFYLNKMKDKCYIQKLGCLLLIIALYLPVYHWARYDFCSFDIYLEKLGTANICWYSAHPLIMAFIAAYNGKLGCSNKKFKIVYKSFYPAHLFVLGVIVQLGIFDR